MKQLIKKIKINTTLEVITGLHIGDSKENVEIGGIDNPVIKLATKEKQPYIPGSSLKGKMRCLLEQIAGNPTVGGNKDIDNLFGSHDTSNPSPSKLIVRDAMLTPASLQLLKNSMNMDMPYTESKWENVINRTTGTAEHPRQTERIPAGVTFAVEFIINIWDTDKEKEMMELFDKGLRALENDYLGGNGSRGYGQVRFGKKNTIYLSNDNNWTTSNE